MVKYLATDVVETLKQYGSVLATAESCTGGLLSGAITDIAGASQVFDRGFVTYSNSSKIENLGVSPKTISTFGAVSKQTASEMALGLLAFSKADISVAITGVAGPDASENKPVGLVFIAIASSEKCTVIKYNFTGDRTAIRHLSITKALEMIKANFS